MQFQLRATALWALLAWPAAQAQVEPSASVVVVGDRSLAPDPARTVSQHAVLQAVQEGATRVEDLAALVPGLQAQVADGGLTSSISLRGFAVSRFYINGLRDVGRLFVRDLATVDTVRILRGPDALAAGTNSPGGTVWFEGLQPAWQTQHRLTAAAGASGGWRFGLDSTGALGGSRGSQNSQNSPLAYRAVVQWQDGRSAPGGISLQRHTALAALAWRYADGGLLTLEAEHQHNHQPFLFGTVVLGGQVRHDQLYASPDQQSRRVSRRQALHWQHDWAPTGAGRLRLRADLGAAQVQRDETLIGFFGIRTPDTLSGYYTRYHDRYLQHDARLGAQWQTTLSGATHVLGVGWVQSRQRFVFDGVQNIGGFDLSVAAPDFASVDLAALRLAARYRSERAVEAAWLLQDSLRLAGGWALHLGMSQLRYHVAADRNRAGLRAAGQLQGRVWQLGLAKTLASGLVPHASYSEGLEPNRGTTRLGDWLPPQRAVQWEAGLRWAPADAAQGPQWPHWPHWHLAAYRITQANLPTTDPLDRTAFVSTGLRRVQGLEASGQQRLGTWRWQAQLNLQQTTNLGKTTTAQGDAFAGVAGRSAALRAEGPLPVFGMAPQLWLQWQAIGARWADAENTVRLPGHGLASLGLRWQQAGLVVNASLHNLFDRDHVATVTALDNVYQGPQRRLWVSVGSSF